MTLLNSYIIGARTKAERENFDKWKCNGIFKKITNNAYVYQHTNHATFSSVSMSQLLSLWPSERKIIWNEACTKHRYHDNLEAYFRSNSCLERYLDSIGDDCDPSRKEVIKIYKDSIRTKLDHHDLVYEPIPVVFSWDEDDWTRRLYGCLKLAHPDLNIQYTAKQGTAFHAVQASLTKSLTCPEAFIFRGAPDLILTKTRIVCATARMSTDTTANEDDSSEDDCIMELAWQRNPMKNASGFCYPEKLGELVAALYFTIVCKVIRRLCKGKPVQKECTVRGLLLDKILGSIHCKLTCKPCRENGVRRLFIDVSDASGEVLTPQSLCHNLQYLLGNW